MPHRTTTADSIAEALRATRAMATKMAMAVCLIVLFTLPSSVEAQQTWLTPHVESSISLETHKVLYDPEGPGTSFGSSVWFLSTRIDVSDRIYLMADIPFSFVDQSLTRVYSQDGRLSVYRDVEQSMIGNPFIGAQIQPAGRSLYLLAGVRLPLAPGNRSVAESYALTADFGRLDAFTSNQTTIRTRLGYRKEFRSNTEYHIYGGGVLQASTQGNQEKDFYLDYGIQLRFINRSLRVLFGVSGQMLYSGTELSFEQRLVHQFGLAANFGSGALRPGIHLRTPMSKRLGVANLNFVVGFDLTMRLGPPY